MNRFKTWMTRLPLLRQIFAVRGALTLVDARNPQNPHSPRNAGSTRQEPTVPVSQNS